MLRILEAMLGAAFSCFLFLKGRIPIPERSTQLTEKFLKGRLNSQVDNNLSTGCSCVMMIDLFPEMHQFGIRITWGVSIRRRAYVPR